MISLSRVGDSRNDDRRGRRCDFQSGMFASRHSLHHHQPDGFDELLPRLTLFRQHPLPRRRQPIEAPPTLARLLDPRPLIQPRSSSR
jgi:hypothetical protein